MVDEPAAYLRMMVIRLYFNEFKSKRWLRETYTGLWVLDQIFDP